VAEKGYPSRLRLIVDKLGEVRLLLLAIHSNETLKYFNNS